MKITKRQIKKIIKESFAIPASRRGFLGQGFGNKTNGYNPYRQRRLYEEEEMPQPVQDVWAGGDNLANPIDNLKADTGLENVKEPESLNIALSERRLRTLIRNILRGG